MVGIIDIHIAQFEGNYQFDIVVVVAEFADVELRILVAAQPFVEVAITQHHTYTIVALRRRERGNAEIVTAKGF
jgi:hypothetical protein